MSRQNDKDYFLGELKRAIELIERATAEKDSGEIEHFIGDPDGEAFRNIALDFIDHGGKRLRPALSMLMGKEFGDAEAYAHPQLYIALESFHKFILTHDDIIDEDDVRYAKPTVHARMRELFRYENGDSKHFGNSLGIIAGDLIHNISLRTILDAPISNDKKVGLLDVMSDALESVSFGRYKQFLTDYIPLSQMDLDYIINYSLIWVTGKYTFTFPMTFGSVAGCGENRVTEDMHAFCDALGVVFQTGDDIIGIFGDPVETGKSNYGDIVQAKKTIPMYYTYLYATDEEKGMLEKLVGKKDLQASEAQIVRSIVQERGLQPARECMEEYADRARKILDSLSFSSDTKRFFRGCIDYLLERKV